MKPYYEHAGITIYHGDCREVLPSIDACDLILTDPPYRHEHIHGGGFAYTRSFYRESELDGMNEFVLDDFWSFLQDSAPMLIAFCSRDLIISYAKAAEASARKFDLHFWYKCNAIPFCANTWKSDVEYIALVWKQKPGWKQLDQKMHSKAWISTINQDSSHPAAKPMDLLQKYLLVLDASTVLDPFMGSGTTLRAAKDLGRRAIGIEIEEKYCEIAAKRLSQEVLDFSTEQK